MTGRYCAFTFVDRIATLVPGASARAAFHIPAGIATFPASLLAEATGQLAAWVAVDKLGFRLRPVAGIAHETIYRGSAKPGDTLETEIRIDSCEEDAVAYQGWARVDGAIVLELRDCVGPMLPIEEFDDPDAMRDFFAKLCTGGAAPDRFPGVALTPLEARDGERGRFATARLAVPRHAAFFDDHFPRRPVFPGTLLLDRMTALARGVAAEASESDTLELARVTDVKLRAFTEPGAELGLRATIEEATRDRAVALVEARAEGQRRAIGGARVQFEARP